MRRFPAVTEVCVQYVRRARAQPNELQDWLRAEWKRTGLPLSRANEACGVRSAATRKYLTADAMWYCPPDEAFSALREYANRHGNPEGAPYFVLETPAGPDLRTLQRIRAKFTCEYGVTNVWREPPVNGRERIRMDGGWVAHINQKPLRLMERCIRASSEPGDVVWEPFGGLCTAAVAAYHADRVCYSAETNQRFHAIAQDRLRREATKDPKTKGIVPGFYPKTCITPRSSE